ncbi:MAG: hypothetical protein J6U54_11430 [Clostridiales bacterium]|nr:hypothetical protein [Clostridiales bacterium]
MDTKNIPDEIKLKMDLRGYNSLDDFKQEIVEIEKEMEDEENKDKEDQ